MKRLLFLLLALSLALSLPLSLSAAGEPLRALRAVRISSTQVVVEFNQALNEEGVAHPFKALRRCVMEGETVKGLAWEQDVPLQSAASGWQFYGQDKSRVVLFFEATALDDYLAQSGLYYAKGYRTFLCFEELSPPSGHDHQTLFDVKSEDGSALASTLPQTGDGWDGVYLPIETDFAYEERPFTFAEAPPPASEAPMTDAETKDTGCKGQAALLSPLLAIPLALCFLRRSRR